MLRANVDGVVGSGAEFVFFHDFDDGVSCFGVETIIVM